MIIVLNSCSGNLFCILPPRQEFRSAYLEEDCLVPLEKLDTETVFYWRHLCHYLRHGTAGNADKGADTTAATASSSATSVASSDKGENEIVDVRGKLVPASPLKYMEYLEVGSSQPFPFPPPLLKLVNPHLLTSCLFCPIL